MDAGCRSLRDAEIYRKRQAGRTLRALAAEFGVSVEAIRGAEFREERRRQAPKDSIRLSVRTHNAILNACWFPDLDEQARRRAYEGPEAAQFDKALAQQVAVLGRAAFLELPNCGKKTLAEVDTWLKGHGLRWSAQVELTAEDYRAEG
jgi:hypothetical protein